MTDRLAWEAEDAVLGSLMIMPRGSKHADDVLALLEPGHFVRGSSALIYAAARSLILNGKPAEALLLIETLGGKLKDAGGSERIRELSMIVPAGGSGPHYARIVREQWEKRMLDAALTQCLAGARNGMSAQDALSEAERALQVVREQTERGRSMIWTGKEIAAHVRDKLNTPPEDEGVTTGFSFLSPLRRAGLYVMAAYTSDGKSAMGLQIAKHVAKQGLRVGVGSVELGGEEVAERLFSTYGFPYDKVQEGKVEQEASLVANALEQLEGFGSRLQVIDDEAVNPAAFSRYQRIGRFDLLIVDQLHAFDWRDQRELERNIASFRRLAREFRIPVLLLCQIRRPQTDGPPPMPTLHMLRQSGQIENEAHAVWFLYLERSKETGRIEYDVEGVAPAKFFVAKNRGGKRDLTFALSFDGSRQRFLEPERSHT